MRRPRGGVAAQGGGAATDLPAAPEVYPPGFVAHLVHRVAMAGSVPKRLAPFANRARIGKLGQAAAGTVVRQRSRSALPRDDDGEGLPVRLVSRLTTEFALMNMRQSLRLVPGRLETSIIAQALIRGALPQLTGPAGIVLPTSEPLIGSVSSLARSFRRSTETIRRHVHTLVRQGFFTVEPDGVRLVLSPAAADRVLAYLQCAHDNMLWLVAELDSWGVLRRRARRPGRMAPMERILRTALDLRLLSFESFTGPLGGWTSMSIWNALSAVSVRHVTSDRDLSGQHIRRSTPDSMRRPTSLRALCLVSGLPYATVWRHMAKLEAAGKVGRRDDAYVMLTTQLLTPEIEALVGCYVQDTLNRVERLVAEGLDSEAIPSLYIGSSPELVSIE